MPLQGLARARLAEQVEAFVEALDLVFGLVEMLLEQLAQADRIAPPRAIFGSALVSCFSA